jgi:hypothetical protein
MLVAVPTSLSSSFLCLQSMDTMKVNVDPDNNSIMVWNNGGGIPVQMHTAENCWLPELIFGHLLTSRCERIFCVWPRSLLHVRLCMSFRVQISPCLLNSDCCAATTTTKRRRQQEVATDMERNLPISSRQSSRLRQQMELALVRMCVSVVCDKYKFRVQGCSQGAEGPQRVLGFGLYVCHRV